MNEKEDEFLKRLQSMFKVEAEEHINILSAGFINLEKNPKGQKSSELIETIFREMHTLKGAARSVNRSDIESICQVLESVFANLKTNKIIFSTDRFDLMHKSLEAISKLLSGNQPANSNDQKELIKELLTINDSVGTDKKSAGNIALISESPIDIKDNPSTLIEISNRNELVGESQLQLETVRIQTAKLDTLFLQAEQMIQNKITSAQRTIDLKNIYELIVILKSDLKKWQAGHSGTGVHHETEIINLTSEKLDEAERNIISLTHAIESDQRSFGRMIDEHVESLKQVLMLPVSSSMEVMPRLVRDLARSQGKEVELIIHGNEIEVDKRILEELKDPIIHLIRNCVDHGIKKPEERLKLNKLCHGTITLSFTVIDGRNLEICISDDGSGIEMEKVISAAAKLNLISKDDQAKLSRDEAISFIFKSGLSTSPMITDLSGRGLGLAIVSEKIEKLAGRISVESPSGGGTTFRILLPLSLSNYRGILIRLREHFFFMPTTHVESVIRVKKTDIRTVENRETIWLNNEVINLIELSDLMGIGEGKKTKSSQKGKGDEISEYFRLLIISHATKKIAFKVDEVYDEQQILVKELGKQLTYVKHISGAVVLGSGIIVPVLNIADLMKSVWLNISAERRITSEITENAGSIKVLVTDDSITSRSLIKNILESSGYEVVTAVDGVDAFTRILTGSFDIVVSDVDMPRMNGFELTAKIRKDKKHNELPVVLVTALESSEDREHGIDVGANAYIVKSSFDQSNLLDVMKKLI